MEFPKITDSMTRTDRISIWVIGGIILAIIVALALPSDATAAPRCTVPSTITAKHHRTTVEQRANVTKALRLSTRMGSPRKHQIALVAAATQEDTLRNRVKGHGTSVGFLQLIDLHGTVTWRMNINNSAGWFLRGARQADRPWLTAAQLAQAVQKSGHPYAYGQWVGEARRTTLGYLASCQ